MVEIKTRILALSLGSSRCLQHLDPRTNVSPVIVIGSTGNKIPIDDTGLIDKDPTAYLEVKLTLRHRRHPACMCARPAHAHS